MKKGKNNLKVLQQTYVFIFEILNSGPDNSQSGPDNSQTLSPLTHWSDFIDNDAFFVVRKTVDDELR